MKKIVLAGGCFWGAQAYFFGIIGVLVTTVGYANGDLKNPTYEQVCNGNTGYAEACFIEYDEKIISLSKLLDAYWEIVDPTAVNRQGNDIGSQYRTGIYYYDEKDLEIIVNSVKSKQLKYSKPIVTEIEILKNFYDAEEYHQRYLKKNPNGYCHIPKELLKK